MDDDDDDDVDINSVWIRENMKASARGLGYYELKQHKPWFNEDFSTLIYQGKQAKLQWLQNTS